MATDKKLTQWLSREGVGSWFDLNYLEGLLKVTRYSPSGETECTGLYKNNTSEDIPSMEKTHIAYPGNCKVVTLYNGKSTLMFDRVAG